MTQYWQHEETGCCVKTTSENPNMRRYILITREQYEAHEQQSNSRLTNGVADTRKGAQKC